MQGRATCKADYRLKVMQRQETQGLLGRILTALNDRNRRYRQCGQLERQWNIPPPTDHDVYRGNDKAERHVTTLARFSAEFSLSATLHSACARRNTVINHVC